MRVGKGGCARSTEDGGGGRVIDDGGHDDALRQTAIPE